MLPHPKMISKNKKAAMEMSMGTIVTIVLVVVTLVLALVLIRSIFSSGTNAVDQIDTAIQNQINQLFSSSDSNIVVYPVDSTIEIKRKDDTPRGFAFAIRNPDNNQATFSFVVAAQSMHNCGDSFSLEEANSYIVGDKGTFSVGPGAVSQNQLVRFDAPESAPACTVIYNLDVQQTGSQNAYNSRIFVSYK